MSDDWFEFATPEHFWMRRRLEVFSQLSGFAKSEFDAIAEIGCGNGVLQRQIKDAFNKNVDGFDLNEYSLQQSLASDQNLYVYDVLEKNPRFRKRYEVVLLFDVLEHLTNPLDFLSAASFMLKPGGTLVINLPALQTLYSNYDRAAGHYMRYNKNSLAELIAPSDFQLVNQTYWGLGLVPVLAIRKLLLAFEKDNKKIIENGFKPTHPIVNKALYAVSKIEVIPQTLLGGSIMATYKKI